MWEIVSPPPSDLCERLHSLVPAPFIPLFLSKEHYKIQLAQGMEPAEGTAPVIWKSLGRSTTLQYTRSMGTEDNC